LVAPHGGDMTDKEKPNDVEHSETNSADSAITQRARRREAALRRLGATGPSKRGAIGLGIGAVVAVAAITTVGSLWAAPSPDVGTETRATDLPATDTLSISPTIQKLRKGSDDGDDLEFSADSIVADSPLAVGSAYDVAGNIPGNT